MIRIAICDDQTEVTEHLYKLIKNYFAKYDYDLAGIQIYQNGYPLLQDYVSGTKFDIIFWIFKCLLFLAWKLLAELDKLILMCF